MTDIVVSLDQGAELELRAVDVGTTDEDDTLAFTVEGVIRGLESDLLEKFVGKDMVPSEIHFEVDSQ